MKKNEDLMRRRDNAIYARFNDLIVTGTPIMVIYEQMSEEFWLSETSIRGIISKKSRKHDSRDIKII